LARFRLQIPCVGQRSANRGRINRQSQRLGKITNPSMPEHLQPLAHGTPELIAGDRGWLAHQQDRGQRKEPSLDYRQYTKAVDIFDRLPRDRDVSGKRGLK